MLKRWKQLSHNDRLRVLAIFTATIVAAYSLLLYPLSSKALEDSENMIKRRMDRIEKRTKITAEADSNPRLLSNKLVKLKKEIELADADLRNHMAGFAPVGSADAMQKLRLEISTLARQSGLRVSHAGEYSTNLAKSLARQNNRVTTIGVDEYYRRSLYELRGKAGYWDLLQFLEGLTQLSSNVSVVQLQMNAIQQRPSKQSSSASRNDKNRSEVVKAKVNDVPPGYLTIDLVLAL